MDLNYSDSIILNLSPLGLWHWKAGVDPEFLADIKKKSKFVISVINLSVGEYNACQDSLD